MAIQDAPTRLRGLLPASWFGSGSTPVVTALLAGLGTPITWALNTYNFVLAQTRLATSSGIFVDLFALDFLGTRLPRRTGEADATYQGRITAEILRPRATRAAISQVVSDLVGTPPVLFEPWNPGDCGAYDVGTCAYAGTLIAPAIAGYDTPLGGYDVGGAAFIAPQPPNAYGGFAGAGCYGSYELPNQVFIKIKRPVNTGVLPPDAVGYGYYDTQAAAYDLVGAGAPQTFHGSNPISDAEIYAAVAATIAEGVTAWVGLDVP